MNSKIASLQNKSAQIREKILSVVSKNGGHLTSSLGAVELIVAMHEVFDVNKDPFIFDVSHQAYAHKLLTGRWDSFDTLRQEGGICGFLKPSESKYDYFAAGHSSTSISAAVGAAKAIRLKKEDRVPVVMIGDGSMTAGMVFEALNELGHTKERVIIVINDNEMSIAKPIGALSRYLSRALASKKYKHFKKQVERALKKTPSWFDYVMRRVERGFMLFTPGIVFEELGIDYIGPIDGHDLETLLDVFEGAKSINGPVVIHAQTTKGKGYAPAEGRHEHWHGVGPFNLELGEQKKSTAVSPTGVFADTLLELAKNDEKICGVTAAMPSGTGMDKLINAFPDRFWDVAICEQHAVTSMAAMAKEGFKPFVTIYSTFLQRGFDQIIHDVALQNLPVIFALDRAGIVGEDGETHQGLLDIAYFRVAKNIVMFAPRDNNTLIDSVKYAANLGKACAFRYPRGSFIKTVKEYKSSGFENPKIDILIDNQDANILLVGYGNGTARALATAEILEGQNFKVSVIDLKFLNPLDIETLNILTQKYKKWYVFSDSIKSGGVASALFEALMPCDILIQSFELDTPFIEHGNTALLEDKLEITPNKLAQILIKENS